jgi:hypothetical protein
LDAVRIAWRLEAGLRFPVARHSVESLTTAGL